MQVLLALCVGHLALPALASAPPAEQEAAPVEPGLEDKPTAVPAPVPPEAPSKAEQLLQKAISIRDNPNPSEKELTRAVEYLYASAGIEHLSLARPSPTKSRSTSTSVKKDSEAKTLPTGISDGKYLTADNVKIQWSNGTIKHIPAVKELIYVFREGDGVAMNPAIAHRLLQELAATGDAEAQADLGFYIAQGIEPLAPNSENLIFRLRKPDVPAALVHYYFAARAGDPIAQMSLAYRYLHVSTYLYIC